MNNSESKRWAPGVGFSAVTRGGGTVTLRYLDTEPGPALQRRGDAQEGVDPDPWDPGMPPGDSRADLSDWQEVFSGMLEVSRPLVALCEDEVAPVWWLEGGREPSVIVTLPFALGIMEPEMRTGAVHAHMQALSDLVAHERDVRSISHADGDDPVDMLDLVHCASCMADPDVHAEVLAEAVLTRTGELLEALEGFGFRLVCRDEAPF